MMMPYKKSLLPRGTTSQLEKNWPPPWSVTFSDITTLLMTAFILWYALTALKYPPELLTIKRIEEIRPEEVEKYLAFVGKEIAPEDILRKIKRITPIQERILDEITVIQELKKEIDRIIKLAGIDKLVVTEVTFEGVKITTKDPLLFKQGEFRISPEMKKVIKEIMKPILKIKKPFSLYIEGHTDNVPINPYKRFLYKNNLQLSIKRASSIAEYLTKNLRINPKDIYLSGYGPLKPLFPNINERYRSLNRRAEIIIVIPPPKKMELVRNGT